MESLSFVEFRPDRYKAEGDELLALTDANIRQELPGARLGIARDCILHLAWAFNLGSGGITAPSGERLVYKSARMFAEQLQRACRGVLGTVSHSLRTIERALTGLVRLGIVERVWAVIGQGACAMGVYAYKPGRNWQQAVQSLSVSDGSVSQSHPPDTAVAQTESTSEQTPEHPDRCADSGPKQPRTRAARPRPRGFSPERRPAVPVQVLDDGMFSAPASTITAADTYVRPALPIGACDVGGWLSAAL